MSPDQAKAIYRRQMDKHGSSVTLRRLNGASAPTDRTVMAWTRAGTPEELTGGITLRDRHLLILAEDVEASGFPVPFKKAGTDKILVGDKLLSILEIDEDTRRIAGVLIAYDILATGA